MCLAVACGCRSAPVLEAVPPLPGCTPVVCAPVRNEVDAADETPPAAAAEAPVRPAAAAACIQHKLSVVRPVSGRRAKHGTCSELVLWRKAHSSALLQR